MSWYIAYKAGPKSPHRFLTPIPKDAHGETYWTFDSSDAEVFPDITSATARLSAVQGEHFYLARVVTDVEAVQLMLENSCSGMY